MLTRVILVPVDCPYCKIPSMNVAVEARRPRGTTRPVASGEVEVDRCRTCGAAWFDPGEIRELTQGRLPAEEDAGPAADSSLPAIEEKGAALRLAWGEARGLPCPRCGEPLCPVDFQLTGIPVFRCGGCCGMLVSRRSAGALSARFKFQRDHAQLYQSLGASMAEEVRVRMNRRLGPDVGEVRAGQIPVPVLVPLADGASPGSGPPVVVYGILFLSVALYLLSWIGAGGVTGLEARLALPSGTGFSGVPKSALLLTPFFHGGIVPLAWGVPLPLRPRGQRGRPAGAGTVPSFLSLLRRGRRGGARRGGEGGDARRARLGRRRGGGPRRLHVFFPDVPIEM